MFRSKMMWLFVPVTICVVLIMLFHWSPGRAQQQAAAQRESAALSVYLANNPIVRRPIEITDSSAEPPPTLSEYWIGVDGSPADDVLRAQLELPAGQGVIVNQVVTASPAEKAGLKQFDVLIRADDRPLAQISDLAAYIQERKEVAISLLLVRAGKPITIEITPQRRPAIQTGETCPKASSLDDAAFARSVYLDVMGVVPTDEELHRFLGDSRDDKRTRLANDLLRRSTVATKSCSACHAGSPAQAADVHQLAAKYLAGHSGWGQQPNSTISAAELYSHAKKNLYVGEIPTLALALQHPRELPADMTLTITRKGKEPARIQVTRGDQSWDTTEYKVDELPEDIRGYARQVLTPTVYGLDLPQIRVDLSESYRSAARRAVGHKSKPMTPPPTNAPTTARNQTEHVLKGPSPAPALERVDKQLNTLNREVELLRKAIEQLRKSLPPGDSGEPGEKRD